LSLLHKIVERQNQEIQNLRNEKAAMEVSMKNLNESHDKVLHENKILKKAVTVQQQRQNQAINEIESARQYKDDAENRIRTMEQVIASLRYHLQAQQPHVGNDFMGLNPRPPDVF
jgi:chromosome segregation ATPase